MNGRADATAACVDDHDNVSPTVRSFYFSFSAFERDFCFFQSSPDERR